MGAVAPPAPAPATNPRRTILEVEVFVAGAATLLVLQLVFGLCRRRSSSIWIQGAVWLAYTLSFPLVTYTFGLMQSSPEKSQLYPVWAMSLFLVTGCSNSVTAYDLDENKQWKKQLFELGQQYVYSGLIFLLLYPSHLSVLNEYIWTPPKLDPILEFCYALLTIITLTNLFRVIACWMATFSDPSKVVADYMRDLVDSGGAARQPLQVPEGNSESDPIRMQGGRYLVRWYGYFLNTHGAKAHSYRTELGDEDIVTVDKIWEKCSDDRLFNDPNNGGSQSRDVCLSFALFHLLKRRYFGINCYEAGRQETSDFVLKGLLASEDGKRAFRIIEVELAFLYDFFFTKYASIYENENFFFVMFIFKTILIVILGVFVNQNFLRLKTQSPIIPVKTAEADTLITLAILGALLVVEILQTMLYLASDWALVSLACYRVREGTCRAFMYSLLRKPIYVLRRNRSLFKYWQDKIGQYSVIEGGRWYKASPEVKQPRANVLLMFIIAKIHLLLSEITWKIWTCWYCRSIVPVRLSDAVKRQIASSLKSTAVEGHGHLILTNGEASLQRNRVLVSEFMKETLEREDWDLTDTMLIWHIATCYREIVEKGQDYSGHDNEEVKHYREVATTLSSYSAYLMASVPELLPGNPADTSFTFDKVMQEATVALSQGRRKIFASAQQ